MEDVFQLVGTVLRDQYRIDSVAGQGGFGVVYRAHHLGFDQPVAVKCLRLPDELPPQAREAFFDSFKIEAKTLFRLSQHPAIVRVLETGLAPTARGEVPFLVLEWLEGRDLGDELVTRLSSGKGPYSPRDAVALLKPAMEGLASAHRLGYAHRDIKPANLYVCDTVLGTTVKVLDFGVAKVMEDGDTAARAITRNDGGPRPFSPAHGAPEQVSAAQFGATGPWTDVHALALVLVELVSGRRALEGRELGQWLASAIHAQRPTPRARGAQVSDAFERVCASALSLRAADRPPDAGALLRALEAALDEDDAPPAGAAGAIARSPYRDAGTQPLPAEPRGVAATAPLPSDFRPPDAPAPAPAREEASAAAIGQAITPTHEGAGDLALAELVGAELAGFALTELLGEGGMAVVFRGENLVNRGIARAIKIVRPELGSRAELAARFASEALTLEQLSHPNIVRFFGLRTQPHAGHRLLVMELELLQGAPLSRVVREHSGGVSIADGARWIAMAARGVAAAHEAQVVHRDLKPDNLFLTREGVIKVLDFGIAKALDDADRASRLTREGATPGSPPYMAPEVCRGGLPDARADVYALGVTLLEVLLGHHPFAPPGEPYRSSTQMMFAHVNEKLPSLRAKRREAPLELERIVERATSKDPAERYAHAGELAAALDALLPSLGRGESVDVSTQFVVPLSDAPAEVPATIAPAPIDKPRARWLLPPIAAIVVLGAVGAGVVALLSKDEPAPEPPLRIAAPADAGPPEVAPEPEKNRWVRVSVPSRPVALGVSSDRAPSSARGFRPARGIQSASVPFEIQQHEVTWGELEPWLADNPELTLERPAWLPEERERHAASGVPWEVARRYCLSLGGNLPTEAEWELAARGAERRPLPWGSTPIDLIRTRVFAGPEGRPGEVMIHDQDRTPGGADAAVWDLLGNALEWTIDVYRDDLPDQDESWTQSDGLSFRTVRGLSPRGALPRPLQQEAAAYRDALCATGECPPSTRQILELVGFRCVRRPPAE